MTLEFESDQFLRLLTDALRAGPGSPEWHEAVLRLQAGEGGAGVSEYKLLCDAREHLESGKDYRSIRPGPGFTRKLMAAIESDDGNPVDGVPTTSIIAVIAALFIVCSLVTVTLFLLPHDSGTGADSAAIEHLAATLLGNPIASVSFDKSAPAGWTPVGKLPLEFNHGMYVGRAKVKPAGPIGGGLVCSTQLAPEEPFAFEAVLRLGRPTDDFLPEVVVSDQADFSNDTATSSHELVCLVQSGQARVILPDGRLEGQAAAAKGNVTVRMTIDRSSAIVEFDGKRLWAGAHGLAADKPRFVAVRLRCRSGDRQDLPAFASMRVLK